MAPRLENGFWLAVRFHLGRLLRLWVLIALLPAQMSTFAQPSALLKKSFLFERGPTPTNHTSTLVETRDGVLAAWMVVFAVTLRELSMAILLYVPGTETLPIAIYSFIDNGTFEVAAAVSVVLILLSIAAMLMLRRLTGKAQMEL